MPDTAAGRTRTVKTADVSDEMTQTIKRSGESLDHIARETVSCCTETITAAMASGAETSRLLSEMSRSYLDACTSSATAAMELARDGMACRTPAEVLALQKKGFAATSATIEASVRLGTDLYTLWAKAFEPILARTTDVPERLFRAIAD